MVSRRSMHSPGTGSVKHEMEEDISGRAVRTDTNLHGHFRVFAILPSELFMNLFQNKPWLSPTAPFPCITECGPRPEDTTCLSVADTLLRDETGTHLEHCPHHQGPILVPCGGGKGSTVLLPWLLMDLAERVIQGPGHCLAGWCQSAEPCHCPGMGHSRLSPQVAAGSVRSEKVSAASSNQKRMKHTV